MFKKIFLSPLSLYPFIAGYILIFLIMIIKTRLFLNSLFTALIGGIVFVGIWGFIVKILQLLLTEQELSAYFNIPLDSQADKENTYSSDEEETDALTIDELYGSSNDSNIDPDVNIQEDSISDYDFNNNSDTFPQETQSSPSPQSTIGHDGKYNLTVNGKTLRTTPEDSAKAIRKTLIDDE